MVAVFFADAEGAERRARSIPLRARLLVLRRRPARAARATVAAGIRLFTRSPLIHVAVGAGDAVLNQSRRGSTFIRLDVFAAYPGVRGYFLIPLDRCPDWPSFQQPDAPIQHTRTVAAWVTRNRIRAHNCLSVTRRVLEQGGLVIPRRITSPARLHQWFMENEYEWHTLA